MVSSAKIDFGAMRAGAGAVATPLSAQLACPLLALDRAHEVLRRLLDSTSVVSYPMTWVSVAALAAGALLGRASNDLLDAFQMRGKLVATG